MSHELGVRGDWWLLDIHGFVPLGGLCSVITVFSLGAPVVGPALYISPLATNASPAGPLDHARRAAGDELG